VGKPQCHDRRILAPDLAGAVAQTGVDPTLESRARCPSPSDRHPPRILSWDVDHAGWVVTLHCPEEQDSSGKTLEEVLAWRLMWLMAKGTGHPKGLEWGHELGIGPFLI
jgi:hypothetical protein